MRLLDTKTLELEEFHGESVPKYVILSHRWLPQKEEITLKDMELDRAHLRRGFSKLKSCCKLARSRGHKYAWIDTCCIDKSSSAELTESINSMYRWYQNAEECYAYLSDVRCQRLDTVGDLEEFSSSVWFTRGWTLQELIAPRRVLFFNASWQYLGDKADLCRILSKASLIDEDVLCGKRTLQECPISQRMSWAARRTTSRVEDRAYSLLGIFNVYMPMLYGEGDRAFFRLQEEIMKSSDDHSIFAWHDGNFAKSILAPSPSCFTGLSDLTRILPTNDTTHGYNLVNAGLSIQLQLIPWSMNTYLAPLRVGYLKIPRQGSRKISFRGYDRTCMFLQQTEHDNQFFRVSVDGEDLKTLDGDEVAEMRDEHFIRDRHILIRHLDDSSYIYPSAPSFYGFEFSFNHKGMFMSGRKPTGADVLCYHKWKPEDPVFGIERGTRRGAGLFRLSGFSTGLFLYLGFDLDFAPLCLITTRSPRAKRFSLLPQDFDTISPTEALGLLDVNWLRSEINSGTRSTDTVLAFKGDRRVMTRVDCKSLSLSITFEFKTSDSLGCDVWHVDFARITKADGRNFSPTLPQRVHAEWRLPVRSPRNLRYESQADTKIMPTYENTDDITVTTPDRPSYTFRSTRPPTDKDKFKTLRYSEYVPRPVYDTREIDEDVTTISPRRKSSNADQNPPRQRRR